MAPGAVLACVVQETHAYVFPHGVRSIEPESIGLLNLNDAKAAQTFHAEQVPWDRRCWIGNQGLPEARGSERTASHQAAGTHQAPALAL